MKMKFSELQNIDSQPIPLSKAPKRNNDHAVISYINMRNQELNVSVTEAEFNDIEFSKDGKYMQLPSCLHWVKGSKGPYLAHTETAVTTAADTIQW